MNSTFLTCTVAIVGGGPAGLMAAQTLAEAGIQVDLFDAMPSVGRKFLLAGKGGLNLTHSEPLAEFLRRYGTRASELTAAIDALGPQAVRDWAQQLGFETFIGTSGRVFPSNMKAAPLLRAWLHRLRGLGVRFHMRHRWVGWGGEAGQALSFEGPVGRVEATAQVTVLALGGGSWPRLGSDGAWQALLTARAVQVQPLQPSNCGFDVAGREGAGWTGFFAERFAGQPFKSVALRWLQADGQEQVRKGEFVATATGIEGSLVYAASASLRDTLQAQGTAWCWLDLLPDMPFEQVLAEVSHPRGSRSLGSHLKSRLKLDGIKSALLHELLTPAELNQSAQMAQAIKHLPLHLLRARPLSEAISSAGGVAFSGLTSDLGLHNLPSVFCAGEMLDWEAPTGGYLLTACLATGKLAGLGALNWVQAKQARQ